MFVLADVRSDAAREPNIVSDYESEYVFMRILDYINKTRAETHGPKITTSMGRELRARTQQSMFRSILYEKVDDGNGGKRVVLKPEYSLIDEDGQPKRAESQARINMSIARMRVFENASYGNMLWHILSVMRTANPPVKGVDELIRAWTDGTRIRSDIVDTIRGFVQEYNAVCSQNVVPISPYGIDVMWRDAFMDSGTHCLWANRAEFESTQGLSVSERLNRNQLHLYTRPVDAQKGDAEHRAIRNSATMADRSGFARLRPYLSTADYKAVTSAMELSSEAGWNMRQNVFINRGKRVDIDGERDDPTAGPDGYRRLRTEARAARIAAIRRGEPREKVRGGQVILERAEAILRTLRDEGIPFTIDTNRYSGQVMLKFENGMELRLIDTQNPAMSGLRMYQNGRVMFLKAERGAYDTYLGYAVSAGISLKDAYNVSQQEINKSRSTTKFVPHLDATPEESVAFVKFCLGRNVSTFGPRPHTAGQPESMKTVTRNRKEQKIYRSVHTERRFYADLGEVNGSSVDGNAYSLCVDFDSKDHTGTEVTRHVDGAAARVWLENAINSARDNFYDAIAPDDLLDRFAEYRVNPDSAGPVFSVDPDIAFIQRQYWDLLSGAQETLVRPGHDLEGDDGDLLRDATYPVITNDDGKRYFVQEGQLLPMDFDEGHPEIIPAGRVALIQQHLQDTIADGFGSFEKSGPDGKRFNPAYVARFMSSTYSLYRNIDDVVEACRTYIRDTMPSRNPDNPAGPSVPPVISDTFTPDDLRGDDFTTTSVRERLVVFDETKSRRMSDIKKSEEPFLYDMYRVIKSSLTSNGCIVRDGDIEIDENGVVRYRVEGLFVGGLNTADGRRYENRNPVPDYLLGDMDKSRYARSSGSDWIHTRSLTGYIGRVIAPNEDGMVFDGKYYHAPGYSATIRPNRFGEDASYEERLVLKGYIQSMAAAIRNQIRLDTLDGRATTGDTTGLDNVLRHLYDVRYGADFYERSAADGIDPALRSAMVRTNTQRVKIDSDLMDKANRAAIYQTVASGHDGGAFGGQAVDFNPLVDNDMSPVTLTGGRNIAINESPGDGRFDPRATGNGGAQGVRYLVDGAKVNLDGSITPADVVYHTDENGNLVKDLKSLPVCALNQYLRETGRMPDYDAVDRANMTMNGLLHCRRETDRVGVAQVSFGGWTLEDGLVVSSRFAEAYKVPDANRPGEYRALMAGDKIECHGNKGVVSIVIDPDMPDDEAAEAGILEQVLWMRNNPGLDVVMAPYSHVSRFNAGLGAEAMGLGAESGVSPENVTAPEDLITPDGKILKGCLGHAKFTILEQTADVKTHFEEDGTPKRSYGAQAGWAMAAANCPNLLLDSFGDNSKSLMQLRELLITCGMDVSPDGHLLRGYHPQPGEERNVIPVLPLTMGTQSNGSRSVQPKSTAEAFMDQISRCGGFVEIPFQLEFPRFDVGRDFEFASAENTTDGYAKSRCERGNKATIGFLEEMPKVDENGNKTFGAAVFGKTYKLPVMSAMLRSGQDFEDGKAIYHDWSNAYRNIYKHVATYQAELYKMMHDDDKFYNRQENIDVDFDSWLEALRQNELARTGTLSTSTRHGRNAPWTYAAAKAQRDKLLAQSQQKAQGEFDRITKDIVERKFESKYNIFRTGIMANKQVNSATAIWTGDPRLKVDEVGMNPDMMKALGVKSGEYVMLHRDPVLRDGGMRYMKVIPDERLAGISVNPAGIPKSMDGDFDGDTIGVHKPGSEAAQKEAMRNLSVYSNLLDSQSFDSDSWNEDKHRYERHRLFIAGGQDVAAGIASNPKLQERYDMIETMVNRFENKALDGEITEEQLMQSRIAAKSEIDKFLTMCYEAGVGRNVISYESPEAHLQSCLDYVNDGAKGSAKKVGMYAENLGLDVSFSDDKKQVTSVKATEHGIYSDDVRESNIGILKAKNMQTQYTGFGGMFSIRAVRAFYNVDPKAALELTYVATQAVLQVKHDSVMADRYEQILTGPARWVWQGYKLEEVTDEAELKSVQPSGKYHKDSRTGVVSEQLDHVTEKVPHTWRIAKNEKGQPLMATRKEFVEQFLAVYNDGMDLNVNKEFVHRIADLLSRDFDPSKTYPVGKNPDPEALREYREYRAKLDESPVMNIEKEAVERYGAPLQRLAYGAKLHDVADIATAQEGLFDVPTERIFKKNFNACMADERIMRRNLTAMANGQGPVAIIAQQDVLVGGEQCRSRALLGNKLAQAVHSKGFVAEAARVEDKHVNENRVIPATVPAAPVAEPVQAAPSLPSDFVRRVPQPGAPGTVFPDSSGTGLTGMNLGVELGQRQQSQQPAFRVQNAPAFGVPEAAPVTPAPAPVQAPAFHVQNAPAFGVPEAAPVTPVTPAPAPSRRIDTDLSRYEYSDADAPPEFLTQFYGDFSGSTSSEDDNDGFSL